jgi:hypothetical protein
MRLEPGNRARSPSRDHGERHGLTWLAHGEKKDEGANHWAPATLHSRMRDRHHAHHCASTISPRDAEVPSSTQSADEMLWCRVAHNLARLSPVGTNRDAHRIGSRFPLGPRSPSSITPDMYPHGMPNIPNGGGTSPRISPSPLAGLLMAPLSVSSRGGSRPLNRWGQAARVCVSQPMFHSSRSGV